MITLLHPSRNRPLQALEAYREWIGKSSGTIHIEHILCLDSDDTTLNEYHSYMPNSKFVIGQNKNMIQAVNLGAKEAKFHLIVLLSDDFRCFDGWDISINEAFKGQYCKVLKTNDGNDGWIVTLPIMDMGYYLMKGYVYNPIYSHLFSDTEMTHVAELEGNLLVRNDLLFKHEHPMYNKAVAMDDIYKRSNGTWSEGKKTYLDRVRKGFDKFDNVFLLGGDALPHMVWLKKELGL